MPSLTSENLVQTFVENGFDTTEKVTALLSKAAASVELVELDRRNDQLRAEQQSAHQDYESQIQAVAARKREIEQGWSL